MTTITDDSHNRTNDRVVKNNAKIANAHKENKEIGYVYQSIIGHCTISNTLLTM